MSVYLINNIISLFICLSLFRPETLSYRDYAKYPLDDCCKSTIVTAGESISQIFKESFFNIMLQFFNYKDPVSRCTLSIGMTVRYSCYFMCLNFFC